MLGTAAFSNTLNLFEIYMESSKNLTGGSNSFPLYPQKTKFQLGKHFTTQPY